MTCHSSQSRENMSQTLPVPAARREEPAFPQRAQINRTPSDRTAPLETKQHHDEAARSFCPPSTAGLPQEGRRPWQSGSAPEPQPCETPSVLAKPQTGPSGDRVESKEEAQPDPSQRSAAAGRIRELHTCLQPCETTDSSQDSSVPFGTARASSGWAAARAHPWVAHTGSPGAAGGFC